MNTRIDLGNKKPDLSKFQERFRALHQKRVISSLPLLICHYHVHLKEESRKLNHEHVVDEDRRSKLPKNYESKRKRQEWELEEIVARKVFNMAIELN